MVLMSLSAGQQWRRRQQETCGHSGEGEGGTSWGSSTEAYALLYVRQMASGNWLPDAGSSDWRSVTIQRGGVGGGGREGGPGGRRHTCLLRCAESLSRGLYPPGSSVHGILQARVLEWVAMPSSRGSSQHRDQTQVSHLAGGFFIIWATREAHESWRG